MLFLELGHLKTAIARLYRTILCVFTFLMDEFTYTPQILGPILDWLLLPFQTFVNRHMMRVLLLLLAAWRISGPESGD